MHPYNVSKILPDYTAQDPRRQSSSESHKIRKMYADRTKHIGGPQVQWPHYCTTFRKKRPRKTKEKMARYTVKAEQAYCLIMEGR
jgi:hypothetical protein